MNNNISTQNKIRRIEEAYDMLGQDMATAEDIVRIHPVLKRKESVGSISTFMTQNGYVCVGIFKFYTLGNRNQKVYKRKGE